MNIDSPQFSSLVNEYNQRQHTKHFFNFTNRKQRSALPPALFFLGCSSLTPQSYGSLIQNYLIDKLYGWDNVKSKDNQGDAVCPLNNYYEIKSSLITESNNSLNLVQIRPWQNIYGYLIAAIDLRQINDNDQYWENFKNRVHVFILNKEQMTQECQSLGATRAHGTIDAVQNNQNIELRAELKINKDDEHFKRWIKNYKSDNSFLNSNNGSK